jgi:chlorite dismutase
MASGRLSYVNKGSKLKEIDTSELIRVFGDLKIEVENVAPKENEKSHDVALIKSLEEKVDILVATVEKQTKEISRLQETLYRIEHDKSSQPISEENPQPSVNEEPSKAVEPSPTLDCIVDIPRFIK